MSAGRKMARRDRILWAFVVGCATFVLGIALLTIIDPKQGISFLHFMFCVFLASLLGYANAYRFPHWWQRFRFWLDEET